MMSIFQEKDNEIILKFGIQLKDNEIIITTGLDVVKEAHRWDEDRWVWGVTPLLKKQDQMNLILDREHKD